VAGWVLAVVMGGLLVTQLEVDTTIGSALNRSDESWVEYQDSLSMFGGDEFVTIALKADPPFASEMLREVLELTASLEVLDSVRRIDSFSTVPLIRREGQDVRVDPGLVESVIGDPAREAALWQALREDRIASGTLISDNGEVIALNLVFDGDVDGDRESAMDAILSAVGEREAWLSGVPVVRAAAGERTRLELAIFSPLTTILVAIVLWALFRRFVPVFGALFVGLAGNILCLACMVVGETTLSFSTLILPSVVLALGCAYSMHVFTAASGVAREDLRQSLEAVAPEIALSGLTTAIGFLAMATIRIELVRDLAFYGALGVLFVTLASLTLAVSLVALWPVRPHSDGGAVASLSRLGVSIVGAVSRRRTLVRTCWLLIGLVVIGGVARVNVASDVILWFPEDGELRRDYERIRSGLSGITPVNVVVRAPRGATVTTPEAILAIDRLGSALSAREDVGKVLSIADPVQELHAAFSEDPNAGLPTDPALIDQYLLLLSDVEQIADVLAVNHEAANLLLRVDENGSADIGVLADWVDDWWSSHGPPGYTANTTGIMFEFGQAQDEIAYGGLRGLGLALAAVAGVLLAVFRDWRVAMIAMVPNALPIAMAFGVMGLIEVPIDAATVCLGGLALGIAVDDTIHVLSGVLNERRRGADAQEAFEVTFSRTLPALVFSTMAIAIGFSVLGFSDFTLVRNLGLMTAAVVVVCLAADVLLLPSLMVPRQKAG